MKRLLSLLTVLCLCLTLIVPSKIEAATLKLSKNKATMEIESTLKLKLSNISGKVASWKSSNKTVATVSKWGTITALNPGTATITCTYKNKSYKCNVKVVDSELYSDNNKALCSNYYDITIYQETFLFITVKDYDGPVDVEFEEENNLITCYWDEEGWSGSTIPLWISLNGNGESAINITATFSDGTQEQIKIKVTVTDSPDDNEIGTPSTNSITFPLYLYSNDGKTYLGKLVTNKLDSESIWNEFSDYGSKFSKVSIWNTFSDYGSQFSKESAFNEFAINPPKIVDSDGDFVAYLTTSKYLTPNYTIEGLTQYLKDNNQ